MKKLIYLFILIPGFLFTSCAEHIYPGAYLPAYPGSYWKYVDLFGDTTESTTEGDYQLDVNEDGTSCYVPEYHDLFLGTMRLWKYRSRFSTSPSIQSDGFRTILIEDAQVDQGWSWNYSQYFSTHARVIARDTAVVVNGISYYPTIVVNYTTHLISNWTLWKRYYFTKDVGVVMIDEFTQVEHTDGMHDSVVNTISLYDYHINN